MKLGCVCSVDDMAELAEVGFDFSETGAEVLYPTLDEQAFRRARRGLLAEPLFPEVVQLPDIVLWAGDLAGPSSGSGPPPDFHELFRRAALVGCRTVVAVVPRHEQGGDPGDPSEAWRQTVNAVGVLAQEAARRGVAIALSPNRQLDGIACTIEETWVLVEEVGHPAVGVVADIGAIQDPADMAAAGPALKHVHLPLPRRFGGDFDTTACYEAVSALAEFGYWGRVSIAADWSMVSRHAADLLDDLRPLVSRP